jgi:hypothetical protein
VLIQVLHEAKDDCTLRAVLTMSIMSLHGVDTLTPYVTISDLFSLSLQTANERVTDSSHLSRGRAGVGGEG